MQLFWAALSAAMMTVAGFGAQISGDARAADLLKQARTALGGDAQLAQVTGLSCAGTYSREMGDRTVNGELTIDLQLPDKMLRTDSMNPMGDATITVEQGFNGDTLLRHSATSGGGPNMIIRMGGPNTPDAQAQFLKGVKADAARLTLALLLTSMPAMPLEARMAGEADAPDGSKADVVDATGPGSFAARLFLDKSSHRPLMLAYKGVAPRIVMTTQRVQGPPRRGADEGRTERKADAAAPPRPRSSTSTSTSTTTSRSAASCSRTTSRGRSTASRARNGPFKTITVQPGVQARHVRNRSSDDADETEYARSVTRAGLHGARARCSRRHPPGRRSARPRCA